MANPLWQYSLTAYRRSGVEELCLAAQDEQGVDINLLLYAAWLAGNGAALTPRHLAEQAIACDAWREQVVLPLRALRRSWDDLPTARLLREQLLELELAAERQQQDLLYEGYCRGATLPAGGDLAQNLALVWQAAAAGNPDLLGSLVAALRPAPGLAEPGSQIV